MNISRDTRIDRRRRVLRDASLSEFGQEVSERGEPRSRSSRNNSPDSESTEPVTGKRSAGYSQDVRRACGTRLVQYIPVRLVSFSAVTGLSLVIAGVLLSVHYLIYVNGELPWYGHPLAVAFDATHPQSIAAWFGSHLWLLCLMSTILTFQLRRHKLDDYTGEYRLWFWIVLTCLLASLDSTTHLSELLGLSLDRWSQLNIGWSGKALVQATLAVLVGVLGIRLCSELKAVPISLFCWLVGLSFWAGGAALAQEKFRIDISLQMRYWLRAAFWLGGLTLVWIASLAYLRHVYVEAQRRFLLRNKRLNQAKRQPIAQRLKQSIAFDPLKLFRRRNEPEDAGETSSAPVRRRAKPVAAPVAVTASNSTANPAAAGSVTRAPVAANPSVSATSPNSASNAATVSNRLPTTAASNPAASNPASPKSGLAETRAQKDVGQKQPADETAGKKRWGLRMWPFRAFADDVAPEYQKLQSSGQSQAPLASSPPSRTSELKVTQKEGLSNVDQGKLDRQAQQLEKQAAKEAAKESKRLEQAALKADREAKREAARQAKLERKQSGQGWRWSRLIPVAAVGAALSKIKLPSLSGLKLSPPESGSQSASDTSDSSTRVQKSKPTVATHSSTPHPNASQASQGPRPVANDRPLPGTVRTHQEDDDEDLQDDDRNLSKAERKRLRRQGRAA